MTKMSIQFHADRDEIASWIAGWVQEFGLAVTAEWFVPKYSVRSCDMSRIAAANGALSDVSRVSLGLAPINLEAASSLDFLRANPSVLTISLGMQSQSEIRESALSAMTDDGESLKIWRAIGTKAKASMFSGSTVINPLTGAEQRAKGHYYSSGAREMAKRGVRLLASAGWNEYRLDN